MSLASLSDSFKASASQLLGSTADELSKKYLGVSVLNGAPVTVTGDNKAVKSGEKQPVVAATVPQTPAVGAAGGMSTMQIVLAVVAVVGVSVIGYKLLVK